MSDHGVRESLTARQARRSAMPTGPALDPSLLLFFAEWRCALARHAPSLLRVLGARSHRCYRENAIALLILDCARAIESIERDYAPVIVRHRRRRVTPEDFADMGVQPTALWNFTGPLR